jgi:HD-GYP domain-containing protein (c-di-GMP phosphodiesterase class II)
MASLSKNSSSQPVAEAPVGSNYAAASALAESLDEHFGVPFSVLDAEFGRARSTADDQPVADWDVLSQLARQAAARRSAEIIADVDPVLALAIPLPDQNGLGMVAVGLFVGRTVSPDESLAAASEFLGINENDARRWIARQPLWPAEALRRAGRLSQKKFADDERLERLQDENDSLSVNIASTYEEISLLYRVTQNLRISGSDQQLGSLALKWLSEALPVEGLAMSLASADASSSANGSERREAELLTYGDCPFDAEQFALITSNLRLGPNSRPYVVNPPKTEHPSWPLPGVRQLAVVPLSEGERIFGYLAAFNHVDGRQLGTVEASLLGSVGAILGIHSGNIELYRQRAELLTGIVRALTSAIDAKDPYTCGHSDRVARVSLRLAEELGCDAETLNTIYLSGLLHDVGKIGIDDNVLRKPGKLTDAEFEHIKLHPELGYKILVGLKELDQVLPVVLHHHESWDGSGYPHRLAGEDIPWLARIVAVADAFDAMGSDRPYRKGMPDEQLDRILRNGAGQQWDARVIEAFFSARDDVRMIAFRERERESNQLEVERWF